MNYRLIDSKTTFPLHIGDAVKTFRNEKGTISGIQPPHRAGTSGKVCIKRDSGIEDLVYASVIGAEFITVEETYALHLTGPEIEVLRDYLTPYKHECTIIPDLIEKINEIKKK